MQSPNWRTGLLAACTACLLVPLSDTSLAAESTGALAGNVVDLDGRPVRSGRAWIEARKERGKAVATAAIQPDGRFRIGLVAPQCHAVLLVESPGYGREYREEVSLFPGATNKVRIVLAPGREVTGRVLGPHGEPAAHLPVTVKFFRYEMGNTLNTFGPDSIVKTDAMGNFRLADVPPCNLAMEARMPATAPGWEKADILPGLGVETLPPLRIPPDVPIAGQVFDERGVPLPNVKVDSDFADHDSATTDAAGRFILRGFSADLVPFVRFRITHPGYAYLQSEPVGKNREPFKVVLKRERWITGRLVDAKTGEPVQIKSVILCTFERRKNGEIVRGGCRFVRFEQPEKGYFRVPYNQPDDFHVTVTAEGYADGEALIDSPRSYKDVEGIVIKAHRQRTNAPEVLPVQTIAGILTRDGQPVTAAWVTLWATYRERNLPNAAVRRGRTVTTGGYIGEALVPSPSGSYSLNVPHQGHWYVVVEEPNRPPTIRGPLEIRLNETLKLDIPLGEGGAISGRVRGVAADAAGNWWVVAFDRTVWRAEARIAKDGTFFLDQLPPGEYGLKVGHDGFHDPDVPRRKSWADKLPAHVWTTNARPWHGATIVSVAAKQQVKEVVVDAPQIAAAPPATAAPAKQSVPRQSAPAPSKRAETSDRLRKPGQVDLSGDEYAVIERLKSLSEDEADQVAAHHLRALAKALRAYMDDHNAELPPPVISNANLPLEKRLSGLVLLLPYFEKRPGNYKTDDDPDWLKRRLDPKQAAAATKLFKSIDLTKAWDDPANREAAKTIVPVFLVPGTGPYRDKRGFAVSHFAFVHGYGGEENGAFPERGGTYVLDPTGQKEIIADGTSATLAIGQVAESLGPWIAAGSATSRFLDDPGSPNFGSRYGKAGYFANCDAAVFFLDLKATASPTLEAMATRGGGEILDLLRVKRYPSAIEWKKATQAPAK